MLYARAEGAAAWALAFDAAGAAAFEFEELSELSELWQVAFAVEGGEHAGEVAERGDGGAQALADRFAVGRAAEVVVAAARSGRLGDDLDLAGGAA